MDSTKSKTAENYKSRQEYSDGMKKRAEQADGSYNTTLSKAWFQDQEEKARRQTESAVSIKNEDDNFKPIPVVRKMPETVKVPSAGAPLKSAMKKPKKQDPGTREYVVSSAPARSYMGESSKARGN